MPRFFVHGKHHDENGRVMSSSSIHQPHLGSPGPSRRSFFGLPLGKSSSNESQSSIMSDDHHHVNHNNSSATLAPSMHRNGSSSMVQLKKFFRPARKLSGSDQHLNHGIGSSSSLSGISPSTSNSAKKKSSSPSIPSGPTFTHDANNNMIVKTDPKFWDDLEGSVAKKYGKLGKVLGSGAGGSVRLIVRESDGVTFAVKEFVPRRPNESIKEYAKKCTAEFCIGSTLHHPNVIQTLDIINENNHFYEVMEYAPIDFFAVVMSGKMTRSEINCCIKQITLGVNYLHSVGLAHRDLKLDNCVVTNDGIVKLIDFGSAVVFKYPFENDIVNAHGIVGSDPYLAPEVLTSTEDYDPQFVDIWSIGIIYCCMTLRRFPWKAPKSDDPSFSLYCLEDDQPHDYYESARKHKILLQERKKKIIMAQRLREEEEKQQVIHQTAQKVSELKINNNENDFFDPVLGDPMKTAVKPEDPENGEDNEKVTTKSTPEQIKQDESETNPESQKLSTDKSASAALEGECSSKKDDDHTVHHHHHHTKHEESQSNTPTVDQPERRNAATQKAQKQIHGPYRLMRLLPHAARPIISKMLAVELSDRATMKEILADEWFTDIKYCTMDEDGHTVNDPGHQHTIV